MEFYRSQKISPVNRDGPQRPKTKSYRDLADLGTRSYDRRTTPILPCPNERKEKGPLTIMRKSKSMKIEYSDTHK